MVHVHSEASHDSEGTLDEILVAARQVGIDVVVLTDHGGRPQASYAGDRDGVLLLVGEEEGSRGGTHLLGVGHRSDLPRGLPVAEAVARLRREGGLAVTAHPLRKATADVEEAVESTGLLEVYSLSTDVLRGTILERLFYGIWLHLDHERTLDVIVQPPRAAMKAWDAQLATRPCVGLGAVDAHGTYGFGYRAAFRVVQTHLLVRERSRAGALEALRAGRCYVTFEREAPVPYFFFGVEAGAELSPMGADAPWRAGARARVRLPRRALLVVLRDGLPWRVLAGDHLDATLPGPGVYRVEAWLGGRLWIFSNAVRVLVPR